MRYISHHIRGAAALTASATPSEYRSKFLLNIDARLSAAESYATSSSQVFFGIKISSGTLGQEVGTSKPNQEQHLALHEYIGFSSYYPLHMIRLTNQC